MDDKQKETQHELFEEFSPAPKKAERFPSIAKTHKPILFSTTLEQLLMFSILFILGLCGVFFLGVLRGKALREPAAPLRAVVPAPRPAVTRPVVSAPPGATLLASAAEKPYTIQLVTHRKKEFAEAEMALIRKMGYVSFIIPFGEYYQVCAGQYASKDVAKRDLALFLTRYKDCFLRHR